MYNEGMSLRSWISIITLLFLALIVFGTRHEILKAWELLGRVDLWVLLLIIPMQLIVYFSAGEMMFSYLRGKKAISHISPIVQARMALEMNFVNHVLPSGGVSGLSYMTWRLSKYGIGAGRATVAQIVRYVAGFGAFITLLLVSVIFVTLDGSINRWIILISCAIVFLMVGATALMIVLVSSKSRFDPFSRWVARRINGIVRRVTFGKYQTVVEHAQILAFFEEMHGEYLTLRSERRILIKPYLWGLIFNFGDVMLFVITFWALGAVVNPAPVLIAYGLASIAGFAIVTPGGAGAYEAIMVTFLATAGVMPDVAIAGIILARVIILLTTIGLGYIFYQQSIIRYGKTTPKV